MSKQMQGGSVATAADYFKAANEAANEAAALDVPSLDKASGVAHDDFDLFGGPDPGHGEFGGGGEAPA